MVARYKPKAAPDADKPRAKAGRPSSFDPKFVAIAEKLCAFGATDADLADAFEVSTVTIGNWQSAYPEFREAVKQGKAEVFDPKVERALAQRALGYSVDTEEVKMTKDGDPIRYTVRKHFPPDTTACIFWLKNRKPDQWRDEYRHNVSGKVEWEKKTAQEMLAEIKQDILELGLLPERAQELLKLPPSGKTKH